jgi:hypothetical protein
MIPPLFWDLRRQLSMLTRIHQKERRDYGGGAPDSDVYR